MISVLNSRKFWFGYIIPIAIQSLAFWVLHLISPEAYIGFLTLTTSGYAATVAYEDGQRAKVEAMKANAAVISGSTGL